MRHLYTYFRSSAAYRIRIALQLKGLQYEPEFINLLQDENFSDSYLALNPQGAIPAFVEHGEVLTQSMAILEYLEEVHPVPPLLPKSHLERAMARSYAFQVVSDIHPLQNRRVLKYLGDQLGLREEERQTWIHNWIHRGLKSLETRVAQTAGTYMIGRNITFAEICLVPQIYSALRFELDTSAYPTLMAIYTRCMNLEAFQRAAPQNQPDCR
ncbi:maleylacetoacetate isomerase [Candidatus Paracaedibacter symbiosus]|uniref:maleylacetoacetate isomerase n=1 Tax=Candidatus Paracaedibacter symbiosus TaxID=244582 RepID=UPI000509ACBD|nr:maleylacetoacetate isomerase [Candidatus Paracaedibacter symbiosus]